MKRRLISIVLLVVLLVSLSAQTLAATRATMVRPSLSFSNGNANCVVTVSASQQYITARIELYSEGTLLGSWSDSGTSYVIVSGSYPAVSGHTYKMEVYVTVDGAEVDVDPITRTNP